MKCDKEVAKGRKAHPVLIPGLTLFSHSAALLIPSEFFCSAAACPTPSPPSNCHTGVGDKLLRAAVTHGGSEEGAGRKTRDNLWRTCQEREGRFIEKEDNKRAERKWCSRLVFVMKKGSVGFKKTKTQRDKDRNSEAQSWRNNEPGSSEIAR